MRNIQLPAVPVTGEDGVRLNRPIQGSARRLSLRGNFAWTFAGNTVYAGCQWGMLIVLAKLGTPEIVGQFALALAVTAPVIMFANLQTRGVQATDAKREYQFHDYLSLRLITTVFALLIISGIGLFSGYSLETAATILVVGLAKGFEAVSDVFYGLLQQHERMDRIAISMMIKGVLSLAVLAGAVYLTGSIQWGVVGLATVSLLILVSYDIHSGRRILAAREPNRAGGAAAVLQPHWHLPTLGKLAWLALPLGIVMLLISLNTNIPRYFIEHYLGTHALGIYAALAYLVVAGTTVINALGQAASPRLAHYYAAGDKKAYRSLLLKLIGLGALLGGAGVLLALGAGRPLLALFYQAEYAERGDVFVWIMVAAALGYVASFLGYGLTAARYFRAQTPLFAGVTVSVFLASALLIPGDHLIGAAFAAVVATLVQAGGSSVIIAHAIHRMPAEVP